MAWEIKSKKGTARIKVLSVSPPNAGLVMLTQEASGIKARTG
jgi:hypothetical protein